MKKIGRFLSSMPFAIGLLVLLAAICAVSSTITQGLSYEAYAAQYGERTAGLIMALRLDDAFHSWWFMGLSAVLCINLLCCNLIRLPSLLRLRCGRGGSLWQRAREAFQDTGHAGGERNRDPQRTESAVCRTAPGGTLGRLGLPSGHPAADPRLCSGADDGTTVYALCPAGTDEIAGGYRAAGDGKRLPGRTAGRRLSRAVHCRPDGFGSDGGDNGKRDGQRERADDAVRIQVFPEFLRLGRGYPDYKGRGAASDGSALRGGLPAGEG